MNNDKRRNDKGQYIKSDLNDIIGKRFDKITILSFDHNNGRKYYYKCKCDCGNEIVKHRTDILNNVCNMCRDCYLEKNLQEIINSNIGQRFGRLTVLSLDHVEKKEKKGRPGKTVIMNVIYYKCQCDCGNICVINRKHLVYEGVKSCGCLTKEIISSINRTHGLTRTHFYRIWRHMIDRCENPKEHGYENYGGRGIKVCTEWYTFENFRDDMYESYQIHVKQFGEHDTSIDRLDVEGDYEPGNCRWATRTEQNRNRRTNVRIRYNGVERAASEIHNIYFPSMSLRRFYEKLNNNGYRAGDIFEVSSISELSKMIKKEPDRNVITPILFPGDDKFGLCEIDNGELDKNIIKPILFPGDEDYDNYY